jgi:hypothetical protein
MDVKLPDPAWREMRPTNPPHVAAEWYSAEQVRAAILAERERCALLCEKQEAHYQRKMNETYSAGHFDRWEQFNAMRDAADWLAGAIREE